MNQELTAPARRVDPGTARAVDMALTHYRKGHARADVHYAFMELGLNQRRITELLNNDRTRSSQS